MRIYKGNTVVIDGETIIENGDGQGDIYKELTGKVLDVDGLSKKSIAYSILMAHNQSGDDEFLRIKFDSLTSHDITYVGIIQTARASGMTQFDIPYVLTNCHNSLCAVGGTINEDDHKFGLSAAQKYGGIYVPPNMAVIHSYNREKMAKCGNMILGSDSHTRYGALGTMAIGEGGGELAKQLLGQTYDVKMPEVLGVVLKGVPRKGVGPQDVALNIIKEVFDNGLAKNKVMEFIGAGVDGLSVEYRNGIDVMTTETTCLSSIWKTDEKVEEYFINHDRIKDYKKLEQPKEVVYSGVVEVDLSEIEPSIALPYHPSNVYTIRELKENPEAIFDKVEKEANKLFEDGMVKVDLKSKIRKEGIFVDQGVIVGCSGGSFDNIVAAADILKGKSTGNGYFSLSVYPESQPCYSGLLKSGAINDLVEAGVTVKSAFCGPCFGAGDTPANNELSIRHATRNFPNRDGSKPIDGQISMVALMDARSIAATAANGGYLTGADELDVEFKEWEFDYNNEIYNKRVYNGFGNPNPEQELIKGPNIKDWPEFKPLENNLLMKLVSYIDDPVTTTDELIPSGETSSYRSNPIKLSEFTLSRKDPGYVEASKEVRGYYQGLLSGELPYHVKDVLGKINVSADKLGIGSTIYANKPGDGSAREQAASCQRVLGASGNIAKEYATKRYRSNLINWGIIPFLTDSPQDFEKGDFIYVPNIRQAIEEEKEEIPATIIGKTIKQTILKLDYLSQKEREIILAGSLINYNKSK